MALWSKPSREEPVVPMRCPWCGGAMKRGYLTSGAGWLRLDNEGGSREHLQDCLALPRLPETGGGYPPGSSPRGNGRNWDRPMSGSRNI